MCAFLKTFMYIIYSISPIHTIVYGISLRVQIIQSQFINLCYMNLVLSIPFLKYYILLALIIIYSNVYIICIL